MSDKDFLLELAGIFATHSVRAETYAEQLERAAASARHNSNEFKMFATKMLEKAMSDEV